MIRLDPEICAKLTAEIVVAYIGRADLNRSELVSLIREIRQTLGGPDGESEDETSKAIRVETLVEEAKVKVVALRSDEGLGAPLLGPAVPIDQSIHEDYIVSLEDGRHYRSLRRHLMAKYGMTPEEYRRKWGLPSDYPMVAPSYAKERSEVARRIGLGKSVSKRQRHS